MMHISVLILLLVKTASATQLNLALGGEATQIDTYDRLGAASNAIDGNRDSNYFHNSCTATATTTDPWWRVDLRESYMVTSIIITNRGDCCAQRLWGAEIRVGNSLQNNGNNNPLVATISRISAGQVQTFTLARPAEGRYVNVFLPRRDHLTLCEVEVYGNPKENLNLALGGEATQIDTYNELGAASNAIDGNHDSNYGHNSCTHTATTTDPWWRVDLRESYVVTSITIANRGDCCAQRLDGAEIRVGNSLQNNGNNNPLVATISHIPSKHLKTFTLPKPAEGRYVNVFLRGTDKYLTLCEVEVYGVKKDNLNLAKGGEATQISTLNELGAASNAIDGKRDPLYRHKSCSHTATATDPWWRVDLWKSYMVTSITITNREDCCPERLDGAEIRVGDYLDNNGNDNPLVATISHIPAGHSQNFTLLEAAEGRYVNVFLPGTDKYLTLCEVEVYGNPKEKLNLALGGEATQIDTYDRLGAASNAIDGNRDSNYHHNSCTHTATTTDPWWRVDLREPYVVTSVTITNREDCCPQRLEGAEIRVGNSLDNNGNNNPVVATISHIQSTGLSEIVLTVLDHVEGRYVNVFLPGKNKYLTLCEVEVYGYQQEGAPKESR